jgi:hypothetical protein
METSKFFYKKKLKKIYQPNLIQFIIKMSANDWFRQRMGNSNDGWNVVKPKQHKKHSKPTSGTYIPPGKRIESRV